MQTQLNSEGRSFYKLIPKAIGAIAGISFLISPITTILWVGGALLAMVVFVALVVLYCAPRNSSTGTRTAYDTGGANPVRRGHQLRNGWQNWEDSDIPMFHPFGSNIGEAIRIDTLPIPRSLTDLAGSEGTR